MFTGNEAAAFLKVHPQTVKKWRAAGKIVPAISKGNLTLYTRSYLEEIKLKIKDGNVLESP